MCAMGVICTIPRQRSNAYRFSAHDVALAEHFKLTQGVAPAATISRTVVINKFEARVAVAMEMRNLLRCRVQREEQSRGEELTRKREFYYFV